MKRKIAVPKTLEEKVNWWCPACCDAYNEGIKAEQADCIPACMQHKRQAELADPQGEGPSDRSEAAPQPALRAPQQKRRKTTLRKSATFNLAVVEEAEAEEEKEKQTFCCTMEACKQYGHDFGGIVELTRHNETHLKREDRKHYPCTRHPDCPKRAPGGYLSQQNLKKHLADADGCETLIKEAAVKADRQERKAAKLEKAAAAAATAAAPAAAAPAGL